MREAEGALGQGGEDMEVVRQRALDCGAVESVVVDARDEFAEQYCLPAITSNALYMDRYPLVSAISRPLIAKHLVTAARDHGARLVYLANPDNPMGSWHPGARIEAVPSLRGSIVALKGQRVADMKNLPEEEAYALLRRTAMNDKRKLVDIARSIMGSKPSSIRATAVRCTCPPDRPLPPSCTGWSSPSRRRRTTSCPACPPADGARCACWPPRSPRAPSTWARAPGTPVGC